ncbi:hypothetical protein E2P81_ATG03304 [Venturia nashicola]|nr:hypothetical protein E2P81_ATG03304 [Venturia nashicola]
MKFSVALSLLVCIVSVSANKHTYCCCSNKDGCDIGTTEAVVNSHVPSEGWVMDGQTWTEGQNGAPFACTGCYAFAVNYSGIDDGFLGGDEFNKACRAQLKGSGSKCFGDEPS